MESDFEDVEEAEKRTFAALEKNFSLLGLSIFDNKFYPKPKAAENDWWGGYCVEFKLIEKQRLEKVSGDIYKMRRESLSVDFGGQSSRKFTIDISKNEFIAPRQESEIEGYTCYVYTPDMIAAEKLRALCQQMPEYEFVKGKKRRARDFYDLYSILKETEVDFGNSEFQEILAKVFEAKKVPLKLLEKISSDEIKEYHENDWASVQASLEDKSRDFQFYYDFVCNRIKLLQPLWVE
jgi:hypothetical protein